MKAEKYKYVYTYVDSMGTKTIAIMDDVYALLKALKAPHESFSDALRRLAKTKGDIVALAGSWGDISDKDAEKIKSALIRMRKGTRIDELRKRL